MSQVQQIKESTDIVEIIGERINLKRAGASYKSLCPFHNDRNPSFFVNDQLQRYKCFACGASGDVIEFLEQYENMTFVEVLEQLADRAGIKLERHQKSSDDLQREKLLEILNLAKEYYHFLLTEHKIGKKARDYLKDRGISKESIKLFQLGYALDGWDGLIKYLHKKKKYKLEDILKTGLIIKTKTSRYYDRFRGRIIFPLKNHRGVVVGFSGRILDPKAKEAKYINTPETLLYHKSKMLYGFSELLIEIRKKKEIIVTEGEFDVISSAQAHVNNTVAIKGSALSAQQIKLFERVADRVLLCLDADNAGIKASQRAIELIKDSKLELRVIDLSTTIDDQVKDADELARTNPKAWRQKIKQSVSVYDYLLRIITSKHDPATPEGKRKIVKEAAPVLNSIQLTVERDFYIEKIAKELNVKKEILEEDLRQLQEKSQKASVKKTKIKPKQSQTKNENSSHRRKQLENYILFLLFRSSEKNVKDKVNLLKEINFKVAGSSQLITEILKFKPKFTLKTFTKFLAEDLKQLLFDFYLNPQYVSILDKLDLEKEWQQTIHELKKIDIKDKITQINQKIEKLDRKANKSEQEEKKQDELLAQIADLQRKSRLN